VVIWERERERKKESKSTEILLRATVKVPPFYLATLHGRANTQAGQIIFFLMSQFLLQVLSRSFAPLPPFLHFSSFFPHPGRGIFPSLPGFTTHACLFKRCAQCWWGSILSTNPFCGLLHSHRQGISRFPQIGVVFLTFKTFVPPNRKHKIFCTPSLSFDQWAKKNPPQLDREPCSAERRRGLQKHRLWLKSNFGPKIP